MKTPLFPQSSFLLCAALSAFAASAVSGATLTDDFTAAPDISTPLPGTHNGDTTAATKETGELNHGFNTGGASVWGSFAPTENGVYIFDTRDSDFDTVLGVYIPGGEPAEFVRLGASN
ncbi:MAG: hypothetical protein ACR2OZ_07575, partial [Verrucomicrobiales bacterium]